jgi:hypothetical protein
MIQLPGTTEFLKAISTIACGALLAAAALPVRAQTMAPIPSLDPAAAAPSAELEAIFWRCDYQTTQGLIDIGTAEACGKATEALRMARFNGDLDSMLAWWQQNKAAKHGALKSQATAARTELTLEDKIRQMTEIDLRQFYLRCARVAEQRRLAHDEMLACSVGQDALLTRVFGGRFDAMLAWSGDELASGGSNARR